VGVTIPGLSNKTAEDIHALLSKSTLRYLNKCHFPWIEQPEEFRRALAAFLSAPVTGRNLPD
jgi:pimeloyl-ACP methyl ester carboxylesterase